MLAGNPPRMTRKELAAFLSARGFPISHSTLAKMAMRREGPPPDGFWGTRLMFDAQKALAWAEQRFQPNQFGD